MATIFHLKEFFTVMCSGPKKKGAVTAAEGTSEAKHAITPMITVSPRTGSPMESIIGTDRL